MKYDPRTHGRTSAENPIDQALAEAWEIARTMNADCKHGEWVPKRAVYVDTDILPRHGGGLDWDKVKEYAEIARDLPPVKVQKDTFVLFDGHHRLTAAFEPAATTDWIRIEEHDIPLDEMWIKAFEANAHHGIPYTKRDRTDHLERLLKEKPGQTQGWYATQCGLSLRTAGDIIRRVSGPTYQTQDKPEPRSTNVQIAHSEAGPRHNEERAERREVPAPVIRSGLSPSAELWTEWIKKASDAPDEVIEEVRGNKTVASEMVWRIATITEQGGMLK